ncbi:DUF664 domain-containing protein [Actinomycetospora rhizophila]|uniref:DUF664 domain-containing protein n=1 Tax=Actinomycetospora rhizophila TaxID=1416876 RepID=A0ABV9ZIU5_9PSEU
MPSEFPEPTDARGDRGDVLVGYLDFFRERVVEKLRELPAAGTTRSGVPSGWSPLELAHHLRHVERRWLEWGFLGAAIDDPWADERDGRWAVPDGAGLEDVVAELRAQGERSRAVVAAHALEEVGQPGPRWRGAPPATLERILLHLVQEYARHLGHLDVVVELATGAAGE